ncbi:MAG: AraC family transcriptional regulator, partial [Pseudomonadota bacterium]|nr:AraC family transcriptional regulator [Pseudomonadota bacterium]
PRAWVGRWLANPGSKLPRTVARDRGWGKSLSALCLQLGEDPALALGYPQTLLADQLGATLAAALEPVPVDASGGAADTVRRAVHILRSRLDQPGLVAIEVALELGLSVRTLHRGFSAQGLTFAGTLRRQRMTQACRLMEQPRLAGLTIAEIGRRCGYSDASHFVREFRRLSGSTPAQWRRRRTPA